MYLLTFSIVSINFFLCRLYSSDGEWHPLRLLAHLGVQTVINSKYQIEFIYNFT
jgi:hypothetical protein